MHFSNHQQNAVSAALAANGANGLNLTTGDLEIFGSQTIVDWADPEDDADAMSNVSCCCCLRYNGARFSFFFNYCYVFVVLNLPRVSKA
jgi:hypothetical protein